MAIGIGKLKYEMLADEQLGIDDISLSEASQAKPKLAPKDSGLFVDAMDVETFIKVNDLKEVTSGIMLDNGVPAADGVLSYEIFGTSQEERRNRFGYIDLHGHYMNPLAALKLGSYDRKLADVLFARGRWKLQKDGTLIEDEDGDSGPEYLYSIWGKVKVKDKETVITKEIEEFYKTDRDHLFLTKFPVIPAFTRDLNQRTNSSSKSTALINSMYNSLISYTQTLQDYTDTFTNMARLTKGRVQQILVDIYKHLVIDQVKGQPSKFGMINRFMMSKNVKYGVRLVITAPVLNRDSYEDVQVKFGSVAIPLAYVISMFYPFIMYHLKRYFDALFIEGGKFPVLDKNGELVYTSFEESFDEVYLNKLITKFVNSPNSRFDLVETPPDKDGKTYNLQLTGRFKKENTTFNRKATLTDILYIVAKRATEDKHVFVTRYPLESYNGQFPARIEIASTINMKPVIIGETVYQYYPVVEGDPSNVFIDTLQMSNVMLPAIGGDFDGDMVTVRPVFSVEANRDAEKQINSNGYFLNVQGSNMRDDGKDFHITAYMLTHIQDPKEFKLVDINKEKHKYHL